MKSLLFFLATCTAFGWAIAQADAPLRTVVYRFENDARGFGGGADTGISLTHGQGSASGTITVDVVKATSDGGLVVDVTEMVDRQDRPMQTIRCALYGRTQDVVCDQSLSPTHAELGLLAFMGRFFYEPDRVDSNHHWRTVPTIQASGNMGARVEVSNDYTVASSAGDQLTIDVARRESGVGYLAKTSGTLIYNVARSVPVSVRLEVSSQTAHAQGDMNLRLSLLKDSLSTPVGSSENSH